jgi:carbon monoxide dehydrogenase subunit G
MQIQNEFVVKAPIDRVWKHMLDVENVAPCMPGAELTEVVDDHTWKGKTNIKVGPVSLSFAGTVVIQERDDAGHRVVLKAQGMEQRGKGAASALATSQLSEVEGGTKVVLDTDLTISGAVAQYGRGMIADISQRLTREFAQCLEANIIAGEAEPEGGDTGDRIEAPTAESSPVALPEQPADAGKAPASPVPTQSARPVRGFRLGVWALWRAVVRFFQRLFGRSPSA